MFIRRKFIVSFYRLNGPLASFPSKLGYPIFAYFLQNLNFNLSTKFTTLGPISQIELISPKLFGLVSQEKNEYRLKKRPYQIVSNNQHNVRLLR